MYNIMQQQAGARKIYAMTNGRVTLSTHYSSYENFIEAMANKNEEAREWGDPQWFEVTK